MELAVLPRRDDEAREHLEQVGSLARPLVLARERSIELDEQLGALVPGGALTRGSVLRVTGAGATSVTFTLASAVTAVGEWAAVVELDSTLGALAAAEAGVALEQFAVVRRVPPARWATVVAALLEGVSLVVAEVPRGVRLGDARRLIARARERETVLVVHERAASPFGHGAGVWPAEAALTVRAVGGAWGDLVADGHLTDRSLRVEVEGRGVAARAVSGELARAV
ncbi:MAG TPA: hypothetical protein VFZ17_08735 [Acidimicrobiia bacterium]|nr:hypothetical protein [Acidimicrobiia bacterium]